ncbi:YjiH family protein [Clostridiaceae bacterium 35-E11]
MENINSSVSYTKLSNVLKFVILSAIGIFMFFIPITIGETSSVPLDHVTNYILTNFEAFGKNYALIAILVGTVYPFITKTWNQNKTATVFSIFKILGSIFALLVYFNVGPKAILAPDFGPFLFKSLAVQVGLLIPIGAIFLTFIIGYGFVDFIGVLMRPIMRPIWKTPGLSAIDAVASFVGSSAVALLITNSLYKERKYTAKEACIVATGFTTVAATFMIVVAKTLDLMQVWNIFFGLTLLVTFIVTAITARIKPLSVKPDAYYQGKEGFPEERLEGNLFKNAIKEGLKVASEARPLHTSMIENTKDALHLVTAFLPNFLSMGLIGLLLAEYTPVFDILGYLFYPFTLLLKIPEPLLAAKATSLGIAEMYLPALVAIGAPLITRFVIGVGCITGILMFTTTVPCILSTEIPLSLKDLVIIWIERTILTLVIITPIAHLIL